MQFFVGLDDGIFQLVLERLGNFLPSTRVTLGAYATDSRMDFFVRIAFRLEKPFGLFVQGTGSIPVSQPGQAVSFQQSHAHCFRVETMSQIQEHKYGGDYFAAVPERVHQSAEREPPRSKDA